MMMRAGVRGRAYLRVMVAMTPIMFWLESDQVIYNSVLRHWRFRQVCANVCFIRIGEFNE